MSSNTDEPREIGLMDELRERRRELFRTFGPAALVTLIGFGITMFFVEPPPPGEFAIATGSRDGNYYAVAEEYARLLEEHGVKLQIRVTAGSVENYDLLLHDDDVHLAIVQGGTAPEGINENELQSLATLYLEPLWIFSRRELSLRNLMDLKGRRLAVGSDGSGTQRLTTTLLDVSGVRKGEEGTEFIARGGHQAVDLLQAGEVDAALFVLSASSPLIHELLLDDSLQLMNIDRSRAYARRFPFLQSLELERGVIDLERDLPHRRVQMIAPVANLVASHDFHEAFIPLLMEAATAVHRSGGLLSETGEQPSLDGIEFPPNPAATHFVEHGPSFFQRHLSFWIASLIDRTKIMLVPLLVLLIPLARLAPPVYRWRIRSGIYRWYAILRGIDQSLRHDNSDELAECSRKLTEVERELEEVTVPLSYMEEFYNLHLHIDLIKRRLARRLHDTPQSKNDDTETDSLLITPKNRESG